MMAKQETLSQCPWFKSIWIIGLALALTSAILISIQMGNSPNYTRCEAFFLPHCLESLILNMKFPLGLATITVTIAGFRALLFRSNQTAKQIEVTLTNNTYTNYITHKKAFLQLLEDFEKKHNVTFSKDNGIYERLFSDNNKASFDAIGNNEFINSAIKNYTYLCDLLNKNLDLLLDVNHMHQLHSEALASKEKEEIELYKSKLVKANEELGIGTGKVIDNTLSILQNMKCFLGNETKILSYNGNAVILKENNIIVATLDWLDAIKTTKQLIILLSAYAELPIQDELPSTSRVTLSNKYLQLNQYITSKTRAAEDALRIR